VRSIILGVSAAVLVLGTFFAWVWIPEVQSPREDEGRTPRRIIPDKTLEELAGGAMYAQRDGQVIGLRNRLYKVLHSPRLRFPLRSNN
jgi:hypothetical protein